MKILTVAIFGFSLGMVGHFLQSWSPAQEVVKEWRVVSKARDLHFSHRLFKEALHPNQGIAYPEMPPQTYWVTATVVKVEVNKSPPSVPAEDDRLVLEPQNAVSIADDSVSVATLTMKFDELSFGDIRPGDLVTIGFTPEGDFVNMYHPVLKPSISALK